jgi:RNA polymerase sigma-70 factor (ECF subfamily)
VVGLLVQLRAGCTPPWPAGGEIDVVEHVANPELDAGVGWAHSNLHFEHDASGELDNTTYNTDTRIDPAGGPAGWHTYGLEWVPGEIRFFVDGRRTATHRKSDEGPGGWWPFDTIPEELRFACCSGIGQERLTLRRCRNGWRSTGCGDTGTSDRADSNAHLRPNPLDGWRVSSVMDAAERFERLFRVEYPRLVRSLGVSFGEAAAADAVQDAFVSAELRWNRVGQLDDPAGWVRRVAINRLLNQRRDERRRQQILAEAGATVARSDVAVDSAAAVDLRQALLALPCACAAVVLHYLGDLGVADVAVAMDVSPGTVKSTLHDARAALRLVLEGARHA